MFTMRNVRRLWSERTTAEMAITLLAAAAADLIAVRAQNWRI